MNELETKVLGVLGGDAAVTNKDIASKVEADPQEDRKALKKLEVDGKVRVVDRRKGEGRGRPASVWGLSKSDETINA